MERNYVFDDLRTRLRYELAIASGIGRRESQQDAAYLAATDEDVIAVVCDGMGGIEGGQLASTTAVEAFVEHYQVYTQQCSADFCWMQGAAEAVDDIVYGLSDISGKRIGAGTTLLCAAVHDDSLCWLSVGDSRLYILRNDEIAQVTNDHNYFLRLNQQRAEGSISLEKYHQEARSGEALISFIGMGGLALVDLNDEGFQLYPGDVVLLCTDGLYRTVKKDEIKTILRESTTMREASDYLEQLIAHRALAYQDNYTFILIKMK